MRMEVRMTKVSLIFPTCSSQDSLYCYTKSAAFDCLFQISSNRMQGKDEVMEFIN